MTDHQDGNVGKDLSMVVKFKLSQATWSSVQRVLEGEALEPHTLAQRTIVAEPAANTSTEIFVPSTAVLNGLDEASSSELTQPVAQVLKRRGSSGEKTSLSNENSSKKVHIRDEHDEGETSAPQGQSSLNRSRQTVPLPARPAAAPTGNPRAFHPIHARGRRQFGSVASVHGSAVHGNAFSTAGSSYSGAMNGSAQYGNNQHGGYQYGNNSYYWNHYQGTPQYGNNFGRYQHASTQYNPRYPNAQDSEGYNVYQPGYGEQDEGGQQHRQAQQQQQQPSQPQQGVIIGSGIVSYTGAPTYNPGFGPGPRHG